MVAENQGLSFGQRVGERYRIISEGRPIDIGTEYRAHDTEADQLVVVLVLNREWDDDEGVLERLRALASWGGPDAPAVLPVKGFGVLDGRLYILRDHVKAQSLAQLQAKEGALGAERTQTLAMGLCKALAPLHRSGRVHGGLSPHSVLVADDGRILVTEAGLEAALRSRALQDDLPWGRLPYASPEQVAGKELHPASDVYVIGALMYEMVSNHPLFQGDDRTRLAFQHLSQSPPMLQSVAPDVPLVFAQVVHKALAKEPSARYRNAGQLAMILGSLVHRVQETSSAQPLPRQERPPIQEVPPLSAGLPEGKDPQDAPPYRPSPAPRPVPTIVQTTSMVVPPPAEARYEGLWPAAEMGREEGEEIVGVDWLMAALAVLALIAVLGLIPLWREVYDRYAIPPDAFSLSPSSREAVGLPWAPEFWDLEVGAPDGYWEDAAVGRDAPTARAASDAVGRTGPTGGWRRAPGKFLAQESRLRS